MNKQDGFTLVELLAVIVVLAVILAIAVPSISGIIKSSTKASFSSDAKLMLKAVEYKMLENEEFDIESIDKTNVNSILNVVDENYSSVDFTMINNVLYVKLVGQGKWEGLTACGVYKNINVIEEGNCGPDFIAPNVVYSPNGSSTYIKGGEVLIAVSDDNLDNNSLKYVWTDSNETPLDNEYSAIFTNNTTVLIPNESGTWYLHVLARDTLGNVTRTNKSFMLDNEKPVLSLVDDAEISIGLGSTYTDEGATATDNLDTNINSKIIATGTVNPNIQGTYTLTYNVSDEAGNEANAVIRTINVIKTTYTFDYTGALQTWTVPASGTYKLEVWGAQGGKNTNQSPLGGKGGYATGNLFVTSGTVLHIYVGGSGSNTSSSSGVSGGFNGGGNGGSSSSNYNNGGGGGGGATDIRLGGTTLANRIIVAGGGGGSQWGTGGAGGGTSGISGATTASGDGHFGGPGTQSSGGARGCYHGDYCGIAGTSGAGGRGGGGGIDQAGGGGGGGGYYGGGGGGPLGGAGGGSGYIGGVTSGQTIAGNTTIPNPSGGTMIGRTGHGYARITYIGQ